MKSPTFKTKKQRPSRSDRGERLAETSQAAAEEALKSPTDGGAEQRFGQLKQALRLLEQQVFDAVQEPPAPASQPPARDTAGDVPTIARDVLDALAQSVQQNDRLLSQVREVNSAAAPQDAADSALETEQIGQPISLPVGIIPLIATGQPDISHHLQGTTISADQNTIRFQTSHHKLAAGARFVMGVDTPSRKMSYATLEHVKSWSSEQGFMSQARFVGPAQDLFRPENLMPTYNGRNFRYESRLSEKTLAAWVDLGVLRPRLLDRIMVCPRCVGLPTMRSACDRCGSIESQSERLLHHFACAYVGSAREFDQDGELVCPKCLMRYLVAGTDFEFLDGPFECRECGASESELAVCCQCLHCDHRFPLTEALEQDLVGYDVDRLDLLALVNDA
jgi:hypothetical protein